jgi:hypothetical protein
VGEDRIRDGGQDERLTVAEAAERLGITKEAVRKRISRRTLRSDKDPDGTVWAYIPQSPTPSSTASDAIGRDEMVELLRAQLEDLRADRDAWRDQARRSDYLASTAMDRTRELESRIRELEAPPDKRESPEPPSASEEVTTPYQEYDVGLGTTLQFSVGAGVAAGVANPLLIAQAGNILWVLVFLLWILPPIFGLWLGRRMALKIANAFAKAESLRKELETLRLDASPDSEQRDYRLTTMNNYYRW